MTDAVHIPYRDSKLTRILQNSLGGNARTAIICTITPAAMHVDESISTLKFASRAKAIQNKAVVNERVDAKVMMKRMMHEIGQLRERNQLLEDGSELRGLKSKQVALEQALQEAEEQHQEAERKIQNLTRLIINASKVQVANNQPAIEAPALGGTAAEHESINRRRTWTPMEVEISVRRSNAAGGRRMVHVSPASMKRHLRRSMGDSLLPESARRMLTNGSAAGAASATPAAGAAPPGQSAWAGGHTADGISSAALGITETDIFKAKAQKLQQALAAREQGMAALNQRLEETLASLANSTSDMDALRQQLAQAQAQAAELSASRQSHNAEIEELRQQLEQAHTANSDAIGKAQHEYERELREARENIEFLNQELEVYRHSPTASPKASKNGGSVEELQAALALEKEKSELLEDTVSTLTSQQELYESEIQALKEVGVVGKWGRERKKRC